MARQHNHMGPAARNRFNFVPQVAPPEEATAETPPESRGGGVIMSSRRGEPLVPVYLSQWLPLFANAGPRAADYARRANLGLDAAARPVVGSGIGGYPSPRETDNAKATFLDNTRYDVDEGFTRLQALLRRLQSYQ
jgi:hypothetical protein